MIQKCESWENNIDVGGKELCEGSDVQIVEPSGKFIKKKRDVVGKKKTPSKKRATKMKVERKEKREEEEELVAQRR